MNARIALGVLCVFVASGVGCATSDDWTFRPRDAGRDVGVVDVTDVSVQDVAPDATDAAIDRMGIDVVDVDVSADATVTDGAVDATDGPADISPVDVPADAVPADVAADIVPADAPTDIAPVDAPADVVSVDAPTDVRSDAPLSDAPADACSAGSVSCSGACVVVANDPANCGRCGNACPSVANSQPVCAGGVCGLVCNAGFADCDEAASNGCEANRQTDPRTCGSCTRACLSGPNSTATCTAGTCGLTCATSFGNCNGDPSDGCEADLRSNVANCAMCGHACSFANAAATCTAGVCTLGTCSAGFGDCDGVASNGCEASLSSTTNCRTCGTTCPAGQVCAATGCTTVCPTAQTLCSGACVSTGDDTRHCGSCTTVCTYSRASATCAAGVCALGACEAGYGNCDGVATNGCETDVLASATNCVRCGNACPARNNASATCTGGTCGFTCNTGFGDCDGNPTNGCEVDLRTATNNCGMCGRGCALPNATAACVAGACAIASCNADFGNCDGVVTNGCEVNTGTSASNCGACGTVCRRAQATATCSAGVCAYSCFGGWGDCDTNPANGCEAYLLSAITTSGGSASCGSYCSSGFCTGVSRRLCNGGVCTAWSNCVFYNGTADCNANDTDRCETNLRYDTANCGACAYACPSGQACVRGGCVATTCPPGTADCNRNPADGCETSLDGDIYNCGMCFRWCGGQGGSGGMLCSHGGCTAMTCATGTADCNATASDGCEASIATDPNNCGHCYEQCNPGHACVAGVCVP